MGQTRSLPCGRGGPMRAGGGVMGQFDQTARPLSKMDGTAFFGWGLACSAAGVRLSFVRWDDARRLVSPGESDRTNDLVALMRDEDRPKRPVWLIAEVEQEPEK